MGTFNLNGRGNNVKEDLAVWLWPKIDQVQGHAEVVAIGFQEIVELSPQQIMSTDPGRRQAWVSSAHVYILYLWNVRKGDEGHMYESYQTRATFILFGK